jgi:heme/copper-type cytochrome/quinol oxidase subunit 2
MKFKRLANSILKTAAILIAAAVRVAGCPMCKASIANAENVAEVAKTMNAAILVLLIPVFVIIGGLVRLVFKYRNYQDEVPSADSSRSNDSYVNLRTSDPERDTQ